MNLTLLFLLSLITSSVYSLLGPCYRPNGQNVSANYACLPNGDSPCCAGGYACLKNGLCQWTSLAGGAPPDSIWVRGSCTDQSWKSNLCPKYCVTPNLDTLNGGEYLLKCPTDSFYYCDNGAGSVANNCTKGGLGYSLQADGFSTLTVIGQTSSSNPVTAGTFHFVTTISIQATTVTATATAAPSSSVSVSSSSATSSPNSQTTAGTSTSNGPPSTASPPGLGVNLKASNPPSGSNINTTALGIGLGVGLGVLAVALLAVVWMLRQRSRRVPSPPPLRPDSDRASYIPSYNHEAVEHNDKFVQDPLIPPESPTSSTRYSHPPPVYADTPGQQGSGLQSAQSSEMQDAHSNEIQGAEIHEMP